MFNFTKMSLAIEVFLVLISLSLLNGFKDYSLAM